MPDLVKMNVLALQPGDRVHERNADWPQPFSQEEVYIYTVDTVDRINAELVHVFIVGGDIAAAIPYTPVDTVNVEPRNR